MSSWELEEVRNKEIIKKRIVGRVIQVINNNNNVMM